MENFRFLLPFVFVIRQKSVGGLGKLRYAWRVATEKEREIFRAEIDKLEPIKLAKAK